MRPLSARASDFAARVGLASRRAFDGMVALAERCRFVVLAGDTFDGDCRDHRSGLSFLAGMGRLGEAGAAVYVVAGNHDAENRWFGEVAHAGNVRLFDHARAHTFLDHHLGVAVHGRSFARGDVTENIAAGYPLAADARENVVWAKVLTHLRKAETVVLFLDEFQNCSSRANVDEAVCIRDTMKSLLVDEHTIIFVLAGLPEVVDFVRVDPQVRRRGRFRALETVDVDDAETIRDAVADLAQGRAPGCERPWH